jgi:hypothetical protein
MYDFLWQFLARGTFTQRFNHVVHEIHHQLPVLRQSLLRFLRLPRLASCPIHRQKHGGCAKYDANQELENHHPPSFSQTLNPATPFDCFMLNPL